MSTDVEVIAIDPLSRAAAALDAPKRPRSGRQRSDRRRARADRRARKLARKAEGAIDLPVDARSDASSEAPAPVDPAALSGAPTTDESSTPISGPADALVARLPAIPPLLAAVLTGILAGLVTVLLALGAREGCQSVRGTESCGGGVGLLAIVAILVIEVLTAASLLNAWRISDPFSTSFLGVGLVTTIAMLFFLGQIDSPWMLLVIPALTAVMFALSWRVTVYIDDRDRRQVALDEDADAQPADEESNA